MTARTSIELEKRLGRYPTAPELALWREGPVTRELSLVELAAVKRIWPGMQLEFKLEDRRERQTPSRRGLD